jgi:hypothetical protein
MFRPGHLAQTALLHGYEGNRRSAVVALEPDEEMGTVQKYAKLFRLLALNCLKRR